MGRCELETLEVAAVFDGGTLADLLPDEKNRAKELIEDFMVAANGVTARYLDRQGPAIAAPRAADPEALGSDRRAGRGVWRAAARRAGCGLRSMHSSSRRREADPARFPDLSLSVVKLLGRGEYALEIPGQPAKGTSGWPSRTTRTRPRRIAGFPTSSRSAS